MSEPPQASPPPSQPAAPHPSAPEKKGLSPLAWVLIILGTIFVLMMGACAACGIVITQAARSVSEDFAENPTKAAAEMFVRFNPEVELVDSDDEAGTMTIRNSRTGEVVTVDFDDVADGRITFGTEEGEVTLDAGVDAAAAEASLPSWVLRYPDAELVPGAMVGESAAGIGGVVTMVTSDAAADVVGWFREQLQGAGYTLGTDTGTTDGVMAATMIQATQGDRVQSVFVTRIRDETTIRIQFSGPVE